MSFYSFLCNSYINGFVELGLNLVSKSVYTNVEVANDLGFLVVNGIFGYKNYLEWGVSDKFLYFTFILMS